MRSINQRRPVQYSTTGTLTHAAELPEEQPDPVISYPIATHRLSGAHETAVRTLLDARLSAGTACSRHCEPFQRSAKGTVTPARFGTLPTAVQAVGEEHDTAKNSP